MSNSDPRLALVTGIAVVVTCVVSITYGDYEQGFHAAFEPSAWAFSIWWVIFVASLVFATRVATVSGQQKASAAHIIAYVMCTTWMLSHPRSPPAVSCTLLVLAAVCATIATHAAEGDGVSEGSTSLLAGWLIVAAWLSLARTVPDSPLFNSEWTLLLATASVCGAAIATGRPSMLLPVAVAAAAQPQALAKLGPVVLSLSMALIAWQVSW